VEALGPIIGWEALAWVTLGTKNHVPSRDFPGKWGGFPEVASFWNPGSLISPSIKGSKRKVIILTGVFSFYIGVPS
jgi:hypothetical protein